MAKRTFSALLGLLTLLATACSSAPPHPLRVVTPVPTATAHPIRLPADDVPHHDLTEWWYYTGHLQAADGRAYGFELVIFQVERAGVTNFYAAHFAITDHQRQQFHYAQRTWTSATVPTTFDLTDGSWHIHGDGTSDALAASMPGYAIDLRVTPTKPPALHGNDGVIDFGSAGRSYYYSDTRLAVQGTLTDHGQTSSVTGQAWKDRQWGNFITVAGGGWDWYSLQLSDGNDLMLFALRGPYGQVTPAYGTLVGPDGQTQSLPANTAQVDATGHWTSPHTGITYPSGWALRLPARQLQLTLTPVLRDQELDVRQSTGNVYWEGEVTIAGQDQARPVTGQGYVELTGYSH